MSDELRNALRAFMEALDKELNNKDNRIENLESYAQYIESENNKLKTNLKNTAGIFAAAAQSLQDGLNDY